MPLTRFRAELIQGHKGIVAALVPFDPEGLWRQLPVRLAGRRHGWPVKGRIGRRGFAGYIGERWGRFFITLEPELLAALKMGVGDTVSFALEPTREPAVIELAVLQSRLTTQPKQARVDVDAAR